MSSVKESATKSNVSKSRSKKYTLAVDLDIFISELTIQWLIYNALMYKLFIRYMWCRGAI